MVKGRLGTARQPDPGITWDIGLEGKSSRLLIGTSAGRGEGERVLRRAARGGSSAMKVVSPSNEW